MLTCNCLNTLNCRKDTELLTISTNCKVFLLHVALWLKNETSNLEVREAPNLCLAHYICRNFFKRIVAFELMLVVYDILHALNEPRINLCKFFDTLYCITFFKSLSNCEDTKVGWVFEFLIKIFKLSMIISDETVHALSNHTETLLKHLFE